MPDSRDPPLRRPPVRAFGAACASGVLLFALASPATADGAPVDTGRHDHGRHSSPQVEDLDRGLVAVSTSEGVFLSWRLLATEAGPATDSGVGGPAFAVFRDGERIATVEDATSFADAYGNHSSTYTVAPVWHDVVGDLVRREPDLAADVVFGMRALDHLDELAAEKMLAAWQRGESSLLP